MTLGLFLIILSVFFCRVFLPGHILFSNDGPLSELVTRSHHLPERFFGCWQDLGLMGFNGGMAAPDISFGLQWLLGPVFFSKFYAILTLLILAMAAWLFFRQAGLVPLACSLGAMAAIFNSTIFSVACWGIGAHVLTIAMFFLAMAALLDTTSKLRWLRLVLAGLAVGMGVTEGADVGAIFSLYIGAFILYQAWTAEGSMLINLAKGLGRLIIVAGCALTLSAQTVYSLINTEEGVAVSTQHLVQSDATRWQWATQWSLPKTEALALVVPGLFGYRMDQTNGSSYWGTMGRSPNWEQYLAGGQAGPRPRNGFLRYTGGGNYVGVLVSLIAFWAAAQGFVRKTPAFDLKQRRWLCFWSLIAGASLLLALGRFAPFYHLVYSLPYFSTIRNPTKFLYPFDVAMVVLFAFGIDGLNRRYMDQLRNAPFRRWPGFGSWWKRANKFEKYWVYASGFLLLASLAGWYFYAQQHDALVQYLQSNQLSGDLGAIADFSIQHVGWFVLLFFLASLVMTLIFSGAFYGRQAGGILLAVFLLADLGLANQRWIKYWNYQEKYASNPVIDLLKEKPYEHRVAIAPVAMPAQDQLLPKMYRVQWLQQLFPYYNVQSFDVADMPRVPEDILAYKQAFNDTTNGQSSFKATARLFALNNNPYVLAPADFSAFWNARPELAGNLIHAVMRFNMLAQPGVTFVNDPSQITTVVSDDGKFALFKMDGILPRAKLYSHWEIDTNDAEVLKELPGDSFDPQSTVIVDAGPVPASTAKRSKAANLDAGTVEFTHYAPKDVSFDANAIAPSVLLLNDHFDPSWKVFVDGRREQLLRCNYIMRGVYLTPGTHQVEFKFQPPVGLLYVSLSAVAAGLVMLGGLTVGVVKNRVPVPTPTPVEIVGMPPAKIESKIESKRRTAPRPKATAGKGGKR